MAEIALATSREFASLIDGDRALAAALGARGHAAGPLVWSDPPGRMPTHLVVRSCWDYHLRHDEFFAWLAALEHAGTRLANSLPLMRWNAEKTYLRELRDGGLSMPATAWIREVSDLDATDLPAGDVVCKPSVSASAHRTHRASWPFDARDRANLETALGHGPMLVQEYLPAIETLGEISFVFLGGRFSHAVRKLPAAGDFRVQPEHGGRFEVVHPSEGEIARAGAALAAVPTEPVYARVDAVVEAERWWLLEVELIEPELFLETKEGAADVLADALLRHFELA